MNEFKQNEILKIKTDLILKLLSHNGIDINLFINSSLYNSPYKNYLICHLYRVLYEVNGIYDNICVNKKTHFNDIRYSDNKLSVTIKDNMYVYSINKYLQIVLNNEVLPFQKPILSDKIINETKKRLLKK